MRVEPSVRTDDMGCDIHFYVEKRQEDGSWKLLYPENISVCRDDYDDEVWENEIEPNLPESVIVHKDYKEWSAARGDDYYDKLFANALYVGRNYNLFSILANVRNGYGFAGIDTGDAFNYIDEPRGIPMDASPEYRYECKHWGVDGHSHSYFTVQELLDFDWDQTTKNRGVVNADEYIKFRELGKPESYCGGVSGPNIRHVDNDEMDKYLQSEEYQMDSLAAADTGHAPFGRHKVFTKVEWEESYRSCVPGFLNNTIPALQELGDPNDVRIVFFFDN